MVRKGQIEVRSCNPVQLMSQLKKLQLPQTIALYTLHRSLSTIVDNHSAILLNHVVSRRKVAKGPGYGGHGGDIILESKESIESFVHLDNMCQSGGQIVAEKGQDAWETHRGLHAKPRLVYVCSLD